MSLRSSGSAGWQIELFCQFWEIFVFHNQSAGPFVVWQLGQRHRHRRSAGIVLPVIEAPGPALCPVTTATFPE